MPRQPKPVPQGADKWALSEVRVRDFMCYKGELRIPIRPLTMLFGANNAGKTAILKAIRLARRVALSTGSPFTLGGQRTGLGTFRSLRHNMPDSGALEVGVELRRIGPDMWQSGMRVAEPTVLQSAAGSSASVLRINWQIDEDKEGWTSPRFDSLEAGLEGYLSAPSADASLYFLLGMADVIAAGDTTRLKTGHGEITDFYARLSSQLPFMGQDALRERLAEVQRQHPGEEARTKAVIEFALENRKRDLESKPRSRLIAELARILAAHAREMESMCRLHCIHVVLGHILSTASNRIWPLLLQDEFAPSKPTLSEEQSRVLLRANSLATRAEQLARWATPFAISIDVPQQLQPQLEMLRSLEEAMLANATARGRLKAVLDELGVPDAVLTGDASSLYQDLKVLQEAMSASLVSEAEWPEVESLLGSRLQYDAVKSLAPYILGIQRDLRLLNALPTRDADRMALWLECYLWTFPRAESAEDPGDLLHISDYRSPAPGSPRSAELLQSAELHELRSDWGAAVDPEGEVYPTFPDHILGEVLHAINLADGIGSMDLLRPRWLVHYAWDLSASILSRASFLPATRRSGAFFYEDASSDQGVDSPFALREHEAKVSKLLGALEPGLKIKSKLAKEMPSEAWLLEVQQGEGVWVSIAHSGSGISQVVPVLFSLADQSTPLRCIQQPELHLHPRMQAALMELVYQECLGSGRSVTCTLVETHSELMVLRLKRLMRRDYAADPTAAEQQVSKIALLYVEREGDHSSLTEILVDSDGTFLGNWPGGFFSERLEELLG